MVDLKRLLSIIKEEGLLNDTTTIDSSQFMESDRPDRELVAAGIIGDSDMLKLLAKYLDLPVATVQDFPKHALKAGGANISFLRQKRILPIREDDASITFAISDPLDNMSLQSIKLLVNKDINLELANPADLDRAFDRLYNKINQKLPAKLAFEETNGDAIGRNSPAIQLFDQLVNTAVLNKASDLHIEASTSGLRLRYRVDGKLLELGNAPPMYLREMLISRIKILANLNIAEKRLPQDGRTSVNIGGRSIDIRISTIPTINGESVVLRFLDPERGPKNLEALGFTPQPLYALRQLLRAPHGMILTTGPTGSGKTTTLYAALKELNLIEQKIITLEDPIEYRLENINLKQINPKAGLNFANLLRSVLRQDPDVIMVGEIRDEETARLATQSALTGHLVLSTLHTNSALGALNRLLDMGLEPFLINAAVRAIIGQRLVRRLCPKCKSPGSVTIAESKEFNLKVDSPINRPNGCSSCYQTGYSGRIVVTELLELNDDIRKHISNASRQTYRDYSQETDNTLVASIKTNILAGETSIEECVSIMGSI